MAASIIAKIVPRITWLIGARDSAFDTSIADDRFILEEIQRAVIETEAELVRALCESHHPARTQFLTWTTVTSGSLLPTHIGQVEAVQIKGASTDSYAPAESTSRDNIKQWRENYNKVYDAKDHTVAGSVLGGYFNLTNEIITFTGYAAQAYLCTYTPDYTMPALVIDNKFDSGLVSGTILKLNKLGVPQALIQHYTGQYNTTVGAIRQGLLTMPDLEVAQSAE